MAWLGYAVGAIVLLIPLGYFFRLVGKVDRSDDEPRVTDSSGSL